MRRNVFGTLGASILNAVSFAASTTSAQPVGVAVGDGIHVRAPFVSVDIFPHGGVSVRAPFTAVDVGARPIYGGSPVVGRRAVIQTALPSPQELAAMDDETLWQALRTASAQLHERLNRFDTSTTWQRYFRLPDELVVGSAGHLDEQRDATTKLLQRLRDVAAEPRYRKIADLPPFSAMQAVLSELNSRQTNSGTVKGSGVEELPPPQPKQSSGERSLLNKATQ